MATSAVTGTDLALIRADNQYIEDIAIHITPRVSVATGTITSVPTFSPYVQVSLTWDTGFSDVAVGQLLEIVSGSTLKAYGVVRKAPTSSILYISTTPLGSAGYSTDIERPIEVGDTVTVYSHHPLWALFSRISSRTFFKEWNTAYSTQNSQPPPVANTGTWQAAKINTGETASFTLPRSGVSTSFALGSATISSHSWSLPAGVSLSNGSTASDSVITITATAGYHQIAYTVTDSNAKTHTAYTWLFVSDGTTGASLSERYAVEITGDNQTPEGRVLNLSITGENLSSVIYPGAGILLREWAKYNGSDLSNGVGVDTFVGYVTDPQIDHDGNIGTVNLTVESPFIYANRVPIPSQYLEEKASPANWTQATSALTNPRGFLYYIMKWHAPAILDMHDLDAPQVEPRRKDSAWQAGSLSKSMSEVAKYITGSVGSASDGTTVMRTNPMYMDNTDRNALANIITWLDRDLQVPYSYVKRFRSLVSQATTGAFAFNGTAIKAWLAGKFWGQGTSTPTLSNFTVTASDGLPRVLEVAGHYYADENRPILEIPITLTMNQDIIDPAYWLWCSLTTSSDFDTFGDGFTDQRCIVKNIARVWDNGHYGLLKTITLGLQPETFGQPGEEIPIASAKTYQSSGYSTTIPTNFTPQQGNSAFGGSSVMLVNNSGGKLAITYNYQAVSPIWQDMTGSLNDETVHDFCIDYGSAYFANGNNSSYALGVYAVTSSGTTLNVWYFADIFTTPVATVLESETMNDASCTSEAHIEVSETNPDLVVVAWHDQTGVVFIRSTNGGSMWSAQANIGDSVTDTDNNNAPIGLDIDDSLQLITGVNSSNEYGAYRATTDSGSFTRLSNSVAASTPYPMIKIVPETDDAYIAVADEGSGGGGVTPDWTAELVFETPGGVPTTSYGFITLLQGERLNDDAYNTGITTGGTVLELEFSWGESVNIVGTVLDLFSTGGTQTGSAKWSSPDDVLLSSESIPTATTTFGTATHDRTESTSTLEITNTTGGTPPASVNLHTMRISGTGTIPAVLAAYEI